MSVPERRAHGRAALADGGASREPMPDHSKGAAQSYGTDYRGEQHHAYLSSLASSSSGSQLCESGGSATELSATDACGRIRRRVR
jgi:hypothetical protein